MRTIEEIKAEIEVHRLRLGEPGFSFDDERARINRLRGEYYAALTASIPLDRLEEICNAEREQRCVVMPCKEGTPTYRLVDTWECDSDCWGEDTCPYCTAECKKTRTEIREGRFSTMYDSKNFGKTVFLTRAAAQAALAGQEEGRG